MNIKIVPVDRNNWQQCIALEVKPHQLGDVGANVLSLAEVSVRPEATARAILMDDQPVGMLVYLKNPEDGLFHIHRFMIDKRHQGKGIGEVALHLAIEEIRARADFQGQVMVEFIDNNDDAQRLYERVGFKDTGRRVRNEEWGFVEKVYVI